MAERQASFSIIVPAYNEEPDLESAVRAILGTFQTMGIEHDLIIVNDASRDRTGEIADRLAHTLPHVRVVHHAANAGVGGAVRTGIAQATGEFIMFIPVDNPMAPDDLAPYLAKTADHDLVVGVRERRVGYTPFARFASWAYSRVVLGLFMGIRVADANWIQAYRRTLFTERGIRVESEGIFFPAEILLKAQRLGARIVEVPARMQKREHGTPTCFRLRTMVRTLKELQRFRRMKNASAKAEARP